MAMTSTSERYGSFAIALHWTSAALVLALFVTGFAMQSAEGAARLFLYRVHVVIGALVIALTFARIAWALALDQVRPLAPRVPRWRLRAIAAVRTGLLFALFVLGISGVGMMVAAGAGSPLFLDGLAPEAGAFASYPPRILHGRMAMLFSILLAVHVTAALMHHFVWRDATLSRILPFGSRKAPGA